MPYFTQLQTDHLLAGIAGGFCSTIVLHPLDLLKVRFAANEGSGNRPQYSGYFDAAKSIVKSRGIRGLFLGMSPNLLGGTLAWGFYFQFYNIVKSWVGVNSISDAHPLRRMFAGVISGACVLTLTNPIWVVKTRMCMQYEGQPIVYKGIAHALTTIYKADGIQGLFRGYSAGLIGTSHGAVQLMVYEEMKTIYYNYYSLPPENRLGNSEYILFSAFSKIIAASLTFPYQVMRIRLQDQHASYNGLTHVIQSTWSHEGIGGFYKGLLPSLLRVTPATCLTFVVYENILNLLHDHKYFVPA